MDLVIMAAGMGSRFGGLKQVEPFTSHGEFILDFSIYDAIQAGFDRIVFIIKRENYDLFRDTVGKRIESKIDVEYVFQEVNKLPEGRTMRDDRTKPLGTGHAIYCLQGVVSDKFGVINADDFYGRDAFKVLYNYLNSTGADLTKFVSIGYKAGDTLSENGSAKRGVCKIENGCIVSLIESSLERVGGAIIATPLSGADPFVVSDETLVSMNILGLTKNIFPYLNKKFEQFLDENHDSLTAEYLLPDVISGMTKEGLASLNSATTTAKWYGVTYKEDKQKLSDFIQEQIDNKTYPNGLWNNVKEHK